MSIELGWFLCGAGVATLVWVMFFLLSVMHLSNKYGSDILDEMDK